MSDIKNNFDTPIIKNNINLINSYIEELNKNNIIKDVEIELIIMDKFEDFYNKYPFLVKKLCKKEDITILYKMLEKLDDVEYKNQNFVKVENDLANDLANIYLYNK